MQPVSLDMNSTGITLLAQTHPHHNKWTPSILLYLPWFISGQILLLFFFYFSNWNIYLLFLFLFYMIIIICTSVLQSILWQKYGVLYHLIYSHYNTLFTNMSSSLLSLLLFHHYLWSTHHVIYPHHHHHHHHDKKRVSCRNYVNLCGYRIDASLYSSTHDLKDGRQ